MGDFNYLTQDFSWNADDSRFILTMHSGILPLDLIPELNQAVRYEEVQNGTLAIFQHPRISALVLCRCKAGHPTEGIAARFEDATRLLLTWPGVLRAFVRVRIMETTTPENMMDMLRDDIEGRYSLSDVENADQNQSFRPWSDEEDSETETVGD